MKKILTLLLIFASVVIAQDGRRVPIIIGNTQPTSSDITAGAVWFDSSANELKWFDGSAWNLARRKTIRVSPTTGATLNAGTRTGDLVLLVDPSGTLATLTVNMPNSPNDGDIATISTSQIITSLTIGNGTVINAPTTLAVGGFAQFIYNAAANKWFRIG